jgi:hypothetical protein
MPWWQKPVVASCTEPDPPSAYVATLFATHFNIILQSMAGRWIPNGNITQYNSTNRGEAVIPFNSFPIHHLRIV